MKVIWTPEANQDRLDIQGHIAIDSPRTAAKMDELFLNATAKLEAFPLLGQKGRIQGTRELIPHENYRLVYQVSETDNTVWILAAVHVARQWPPIPGSES